MNDTYCSACTDKLHRCWFAQVAAIVGGMAAQKQQRILKQHPEIVVATPGRLWELISRVR